MRQVPVFSSFLIVGNGRLARHLRHYFSLENVPFRSWYRQQNQDLQSALRDISHVLLAISDRAIEPFYSEYPELSKKQCVHFSGSLYTNNIPGAHPLMTFADELYDLETYRQIPFVIERGGPRFEELLPGLKNKFYELDPDKKGLYHALCSLSGNFTVMLWEKVFREFENKLGLPKEVLVPYLQRTAANLAQSPKEKSVLTGPLVRGDQATIERHLSVLSGDPYRKIYAAFVAAHSAIAEGVQA